VPPSQTVCNAPGRDVHLPNNIVSMMEMHPLFPVVVFAGYDVNGSDPCVMFSRPIYGVSRKAESQFDCVLPIK